MVRNLCLSLVFLTLFNVLTMGEWNILNQNGKNNFGISLKNYCESWRMNVELHNIKNFEVTPQECIDYIGKYMTSTQYKVDIGVALDQVTLYLSSNFVLKGDGKDAWVFDIDDTLLSTVPYYKKHNYGGEKLNKSCLEAWMKTSKAPAVEHALDLFNEIKGKGIKIFLISSRSELLREATINNLVNVGYYGWTSLILRELKDDSINVQSFKADQRKKLKDAGYRIWGIVGDHWSSFEGYPAAMRTFKLPNSLYYVA